MPESAGCGRDRDETPADVNRRFTLSSDVDSIVPALLHPRVGAVCLGGAPGSTALAFIAEEENRLSQKNQLCSAVFRLKSMPCLK